MNLDFRFDGTEESNVSKWSRGKSYNVEYKLGNGKIDTFNNVLDWADGEYLYFCSEKGGLDIIKQENLISMICKPSTSIINVNKSIIHENGSIRKNEK